MIQRSLPNNMGASIQDLSSFRKKKEEEKKKESRDYQQIEFNKAVDYIFTDWECAYLRGNIAEFISSRIGVNVKDAFDLNAIASVEKSLGMEIALFYPRALQTNPNGYIAGFNHSKYALATPEMPSEAEARVMNILLFLEVSEMSKQGII
jgi:hypothetical protein